MKKLSAFYMPITGSFLEMQGQKAVLVLAFIGLSFNKSSFLFFK